MTKFVVTSVSAFKAEYFTGGVQAFDATIHTTCGDIEVTRLGNPGRHDTPEEWAKWKFPVGSSVDYLAQAQGIRRVAEA